MDLQNSVLDRFGAGEPYLDKVIAVQERAEAIACSQQRCSFGRPMS
jgi:hypothetical protein